MLNILDNTPFVSIVFPNYNGGNFILKTIDSLINLNYPYENFEIIIVDNGSQDYSLHLIKQCYAKEIENSKIKPIELPKNIGAPSAYNIGIKNSCKECQFVLKMDNDLVLDRNCLNALIEPFKNNRDIGITGGKVLYYSLKNRIHLIGTMISPFYAGGRGIGKYKLDNKKFDREIELDAVNGCMMLIKKEVFDKIGLMDENYFLYFDDIDLSLRAKRAGFRRVYCYKARAYHNTSLPNKRFQSEKWLHYAIYNSFYFTKRNYKGISRLIFFFAINIRIIGYAVGVLLNNKLSFQKKLLITIFNSYKKGLELFFQIA